jgi:hypothetical protein
MVYLRTFRLSKNFFFLALQPKSGMCVFVRARARITNKHTRTNTHTHTHTNTHDTTPLNEWSAPSRSRYLYKTIQTSETKNHDLAAFDPRSQHKRGRDLILRPHSHWNLLFLRFRDVQFRLTESPLILYHKTSLTSNIHYKVSYFRP